MPALCCTRRVAVQRALAVAGTAAFGSARAGAQPAATPLRCDDLTAPPPLELPAAERERHMIYLALAMALTFDAWGVDPSRSDLVADFGRAAPGRKFGAYLGHNVGALLVDETGQVISFALNRNVARNSTLEHAEARAVRGGIDAANSTRPRRGAQSWSFGRLLKSDFIYATLEPCTQCAGIMDLASIGTVVYGQDDPAQNHITNVLYNLRRSSTAGLRGPLPMRATFVPWWDRLAAAYDEFLEHPPEGRRGVTSFLETVAAYRVFADAASTFDTIEPVFAQNRRALSISRTFRRRWGSQVRSGLLPVRL